MSDTILFGDDDTETSDVAWLWLNSHRWPGWSVDVLTATTPEIVRAADHPRCVEPWSPPHPRRAFHESELSTVTHLHCDRDPRLALLRAADLLVVGRRGHRYDGLLHLGSTLEWLISRPPSPLLVARRGVSTRTAMILHDGSSHAEAATDAFCRLPWAPEVEVRVLVVDDGRVDAAHALLSASDRLDAAGVEHTSQRLVGEAGDTLVAEVGRADADLVVMGTRGLSLPQRWRVGSNARTMAHATGRCLLLACRSPAGEDVPS